MRNNPVDGDVLGKLSNGTKITIIGETNGWYMINYKGHTGYISGEYVSVSSSWSISVSVVNESLKDKIIAYLKENGLNPNVMKNGG